MLEGVNLIEEAFRGADILECVFYSGSFTESNKGKLLLDRMRKAGVETVPVVDSVLSRISTVETSPGILAVAKMKKWNLWDFSLSRETFLVVCDSVQDPGNMGTIIRTADAAGADGVILTEECVDLYNPKTIRATAGSIFHIPVVTGVAPEHALLWLKDRNIRRIVADPHGVKNYSEVDYASSCAFVFSHEAHGVSVLWVKGATEVVKIPIFGKAESLNVATTAAIFLYEAARQRRMGKTTAVKKENMLRTKMQ